MPRCKADSSIERVESDAFKFPLGVYPVEEMTPKAGYASFFEPADGGEDVEAATEWEEWPDRYVFDIVVSAERVEPLCRMLFSLMPGRVYPILDVLGQDAYREIDPYISYDLIGLDRFLDDVREYRDLFYEDGMVGFGAMSEDPFMYVFVDEHKIVTVRVQPELKERVEKILAAFDCEENPEPAGADSAAHEHRGVLLSDRSADGMRFEEIVEVLKDEWRLLLNVDAEQNLDESGKDLGITPWRLVIRFDPDDRSLASYVEVALAAPNLREAEEAGIDAAARLLGDVDPETHQPSIVGSDRLSREQLTDLLKTAASKRRSRAKRPPAKSSGAIEDVAIDPPPSETEPLKAGQLWLARIIT